MNQLINRIYDLKMFRIMKCHHFYSYMRQHTCYKNDMESNTVQIKARKELINKLDIE